MSAAAVATGIPTRRNSSSIPAAPASAGSATERVRRLSAAAPPPAPVSTGSISSTAARMTSLAQAAALATAEKARSPQSVKGVRPTRSNSNGSTTRASAARGASLANNNGVVGVSSSSTNKSRPRANKQHQQQREVVMTRTRTGRATPAVAAGAVELEEGPMYLTICVLGLKFKCLVQKEWPCEAMVATAIAEYHLAYPACEIPDFNTIYHMEKKEFLRASDPIGSFCADNDEIELGITEKPVLASPTASVPARSVASSGGSLSTEDKREMFDFMIMFHRLPLGFTLKQNNEHIVVANIYPHSTATHYERLETGVTVLKIADTLLENLGLRQVHDLIKNAKIPLEICFRGYKKPSLRSSLLLAAAANPASTTTTPTDKSGVPARGRSGSSLKPEDDGVSPSPPASSVRERARASSNASSGKRTVEILTVPGDDDDAAAAAPPTHSVPKQRLSIDRGKRANGQASPYKRSTGRNRRSSQESRTERDLLKSLELCDNNQSTDGRPLSAQSNGRRARQSSSGAASVHAGEVGNDDEEPADVRGCDGDSNQNEGDETEELLVDKIKTLQVALLKKHEEAKQIARQIELFHEKLTAVRSKIGKGDHGHEDDHTYSSITATALPRRSSSGTQAPTSSSSLKLRLTPEVLEAMDSKAGVPPKTSAFYQSSNISSVSGYSNYSSRSNAAPRSGTRATSSRRGDNNMRSDVSVSSATSEHRRNSNPRSPRSQCMKNINNRYSYIPQKYTANASSSAEAPTSLSSRGAVMSRAKATRDSFITKSESPGVGYYDVKLPSSHVKGGEIGDSDRSLPWP